jgi:hypothetical protein
MVLFGVEVELSGNSSMVEHQPSKLRVAGSSLVSRSIINGCSETPCFVVFSVTVLRPRNSVVEYLLGKEEAIGSSPIVGSKYQSVCSVYRLGLVELLSKET